MGAFPRFFLLTLALSAAGCGRIDLWRGAYYERAGRIEEALQCYASVADGRPSSSAAPEALFRAARLSAAALGDYDSARRWHERLIKNYAGQTKWRTRSELALFNTPNYFPLVEGAEWVEGDSDSGGANARIRVTCRAATPGPGYVLARTYFAGDQQVKSLSGSSVFRKEGLELREYPVPGESYGVILKYPFLTDAVWTLSKGGARFQCLIEGLAQVRVRAGLFRDCLKVRVTQAGRGEAWKVEYYAPGVGKVLTSVASAAGERRQTELLSYSLPGAEEKPPRAGLWARAKKMFSRSST